jgi:hypothetical protein
MTTAIGGGFLSLNKISKASPKRISFDCNKFCKIFVFGFVGRNKPTICQDNLIFSLSNPVLSYQKSVY